MVRNLWNGIHGANNAFFAEFVKKLHNDGHKIVIYTNNQYGSAILDFLDWTKLLDNDVI